MTTSVLVILVGSLPILLLSRRALLKPKTHGFYRFFVFELILMLVAMNAGSWFAEPLALRQLASWTLLLLSLLLAVHGFYLLNAAGRSGRARGAANLPFENTAGLVTTGAFRYIRHPLYASLMYGSWGVALKSPHWPSLVLAGVCTGLLVVTARIEELENLASFGEEYRRYMRGTRMFTPWLF